MSGQTNAMEWMDALLYLMKRIIINLSGALLVLVFLFCGGFAIYANSLLWWGVITEWTWNWDYFKGGAIFGAISVVCLLLSIFLFSLKKTPTDDKASIED
jgi:hypothetical protein